MGTKTIEKNKEKNGKEMDSHMPIDRINVKEKSNMKKHDMKNGQNKMKPMPIMNENK